MAGNTHTPSEGINEEQVQSILDNHADERDIDADGKSHDALREQVQKATLETLNELARRILTEEHAHTEDAKKALKAEIQERLKAEKNNIRDRVDLTHLSVLGNVEDDAEHPRSETQKTIQGWADYAKPFIQEIPLIGESLAKMMDVRNMEKMWYGLIAKFGSWIPKEVKEWLPDDIIKGPETWANCNVVRLELEEAKKLAKPKIGEVILIATVEPEDLEFLAEKRKEKKGLSLKQLTLEYIANERMLNPAGRIVVSVKNLFKKEEQEKALKEKEEKERLVKLKNTINLGDKVTEVRLGETTSLVGTILTVSKTDAEKETLKAGSQSDQFVALLKEHAIPEHVDIALGTETTKIEWDGTTKKMALNMKDKDMFESLLKIAEKEKKDGISIVEIRSGDDLSTTTIQLKVASKSILEVKKDSILVDAVANHFATLDANAPTEREKIKKWNFQNGAFIPVI
jgi:hypothetical protein